LHRNRRGLAVVNRRDPAVRRPDDHEAAPADAARERLGNAQHGRSHDRSVDRIRAVTQRLDGGLAGEHLNGCHRAASPGRGRWPTRCRLRRTAGSDDQQRSQSDQGEEQIEPGTSHESPVPRMAA
jgi:hypothetical protein